MAPYGVCLYQVMLRGSFDFEFSFSLFVEGVNSLKL